MCLAGLIGSSFVMTTKEPSNWCGPLRLMGFTVDGRIPAPRNETMVETIAFVAAKCMDLATVRSRV